MKQTFLLTFLLAAAGIAHAQSYKIPVQNSSAGKLTLRHFPGNLPVKGYSGTDIIITSDRNLEAPARAKGLKAVYASGTDNTGIAVAMEKNGNQVTLTCLLPITQSASYTVQVPESFALTVDNECGNAGDISVSDVKGEIDISNCADISLKSVPGPVVLSSISGNITVEMTGLDKEKPVSITSISGDIDVSLPAATRMDLQMENTTGKIYSDFDFPSDDKKLRLVGGNSIRTQLNGGGAHVKLTNISGDIYLRKKG